VNILDGGGGRVTALGRAQVHVLLQGAQMIFVHIVDERLDCRLKVHNVLLTYLEFIENILLSKAGLTMRHTRQSA